MPLIPALISANAHYKNTKDRLADEAQRQAKLDAAELKRQEKLLSEIDPETADALRQALQPPDLGPLPSIPRGTGNYGEYVPLSQRPKNSR
jgi:hypothetical protein